MQYLGGRSRGREFAAFLLLLGLGVVGLVPGIGALIDGRASDGVLILLFSAACIAAAVWARVTSSRTKAAHPVEHLPQWPARWGGRP